MPKRILEDKRTVLFFFVAGIISLAILAGTLNNITFRPRQPLYRPEANHTDAVSITGMVESFLAVPAWKRVAFFISVFLVILLVGSLLSPETRKRLIRALIRAGLIVWAVSYFLQKNPEILANFLLRFNAPEGMGDLTLTEDIPPPVFEPPQVSDTLSFLIALGIVLSAAVIFWLTYLWWKRQYEQLNVRSPLEQIANAARASLHELSREASPDAIIRCYENMSQAVSKRRGLERAYTMTATEFAHKLKNAGIPSDPINRLTRLFESARYGSRASTQDDVDEAVSCLTSILQYCGENS